MRERKEIFVGTDDVGSRQLNCQFDELLVTGIPLLLINRRINKQDTTVI